MPDTRPLQPVPEGVRWACERQYAKPEVATLVRALPAAAAFMARALDMGSTAQVEEAAIAREALLADALHVAKGAETDPLTVVREYIGAFHRR